MKLAVTDACIFIDLCDSELVVHFFSLDIEVHTSLDVFNELFSDQQQILQIFQSVGKLTIHNISSEGRAAILQTLYPKALSEMDKTVLHLATTLDAIVLSSDGVVRKFAGERSIECHGMLWILDKLVADSHLSLKQAGEALQRLTEANYMYRNNVKLAAEISSRLKAWRGT